MLTSFNTIFTHNLVPCALVGFSGTDFVSTSGLPAGARGLWQFAAVSKRWETPAGVRLHSAWEEGHLCRWQTQVLLRENQTPKGHLTISIKLIQQQFKNIEMGNSSDSAPSWYLPAGVDYITQAPWPVSVICVYLGLNAKLWQGPSGESCQVYLYSSISLAVSQLALHYHSSYRIRHLRASVNSR